MRSPGLSLFPFGAAAVAATSTQIPEYQPTPLPALFHSQIYQNTRFKITYTMITPLPDLFFSSLVMLPDSKTKTKRLVEHTFSQIKNLKSVPLISLFLISGITYVVLAGSNYFLWACWLDAMGLLKRASNANMFSDHRFPLCIPNSTPYKLAQIPLITLKQISSIKYIQFNTILILPLLQDRQAGVARM